MIETAAAWLTGTAWGMVVVFLLILVAAIFFVVAVSAALDWRYRILPAHKCTPVIVACLFIVACIFAVIVSAHQIAP